MLHYLEDWTARLAELRRVLRPGGRLIAYVNQPIQGHPIVRPGADYWATYEWSDEITISSGKTRLRRRPMLLVLFRYQAPCGTVFGHTGNTAGYTQFVAATGDGRRSMVVSVNPQITPTVHPERFPEPRQIFDLAVAAALACP